ncbi:MAG TPA: RdgB/HAM1 family non-canonical purine NTP pyrophosphatase [Bacteroidota bacterium]
MKQLVLATNNRHKIQEIKTLLKELEIEILTTQDIPNLPPLVEDGSTFKDNALKKARTVHQYSKLPALADDSGLEVFYLNLRPGVLSARYAGERASDEQNNRKLLLELRGVAPRRRLAQFRSLIAFVANGIEEATEGICTGRIGEEPRGTNGFGYDPLFIPDGFTRTYAELTGEEKNAISHRSKSLQKMVEILKEKLR